MKIFLALWFFPLALFWGWYALSVNDISFGIHMLSRDVHDLVFAIYGNTLGIDPAKIPGMVAYACVFDSAIVLAIAAFRWRAMWYPQTKAAFNAYWHGDAREIEAEEFSAQYSRSGPAHPAE